MLTQFPRRVWFCRLSRRFLAQELENVWLFRHCTSEQKFKSIFWIFPVKTKMQMNLFDFTCQDTKFKSTLSKHKFKSICLNFHFKAKIQINLLDFSCKNTCKWIYLILPVKTQFLMNFHVKTSKLLFEQRRLCVRPSVWVSFCKFFFCPKWIKFANSVNRHLQF